MADRDPAQVPRLPVPFMNADHALEARLLGDVGRALSDHRRGEGALAAVLERLSIFAVHTREHFLREETLMRETHFPAYVAHKGEHDRILAEMNAEAQVFRDRGDADRLERYLFERLPARFASHLRTMDAAAAASPGAATPR